MMTDDGMTFFRIAALAAAGLALSSPALADVKAGVDAWSHGDFKKAVEEWRGAAIAGDADAQFNLGQAYKLGRGVPVDLALAEEWYRKAAQQGHPQAADNYGLALFQNNKRDQAVSWLEKSAARGEPRAQFVLGTMYFNGDSVARDWVRAYALTTRASSSGLSQASATLAQMDRYIGLKERQQGIALARKYEQDAARPQLPPELTASSAGTPRPVGTAVTHPPARSASPDATLAAPGQDRSNFAASTSTPASTARAPSPNITGPAERQRAPDQRASTPPAPLPAPRATPAAQPKPHIDGGWRVQLGAFRDVDNARNLFSSLQRRVGALGGMRSYLLKAGAVTKLQVGPLGSSAEASRLCGAIRPTGTECVPMRK